MSEVENLVCWERDVYVQLLLNYLRELEQKQRQNAQQQQR